MEEKDSDNETESAAAREQEYLNNRDLTRFADATYLPDVASNLVEQPENINHLIANFTKKTPILSDKPMRRSNYQTSIGMIGTVTSKDSKKAQEKFKKQGFTGQMAQQNSQRNRVDVKSLVSNIKTNTSSSKQDKKSHCEGIQHGRNTPQAAAGSQDQHRQQLQPRALFHPSSSACQQVRPGLPQVRHPVPHVPTQQPMKRQRLPSSTPTVLPPQRVRGLTSKFISRLKVLV